jgi:dethiobiotin synthetase
MRRPNRHRCIGLFVTGTGTAVGKTVLSAALAKALSRGGIDVGVMKPIETGVSRGALTDSDAARLRVAANSADTLDEIRPYAFRKPVAPLTAARFENKQVVVSSLIRAYYHLQSRHEFMLVEGIGGVRVPIAPSADVLALIARMKASVVVVAKVGLGEVNHALLTLEALRANKIPIVALVLNRSIRTRTASARVQERSTVSLLRRLARVPVIGPLPYCSSLESNWSRGIAQAARSSEIRRLAKLVLASA